jgi:hypothetical protein
MAGAQNRRGDPIPGNFMRGNGPRVYRTDRASKSLARSELKGPLHGVPITIKDNLDTAGTISTGGTKGRKVLALVVVAAGEQQLFLRLAELRLTWEAIQVAVFAFPPIFAVRRASNQPQG